MFSRIKNFFSQAKNYLVKKFFQFLDWIDPVTEDKDLQAYLSSIKKYDRKQAKKPTEQNTKIDPKVETKNLGALSSFIAPVPCVLPKQKSFLSFFTCCMKRQAEVPVSRSPSPFGKEAQAAALNGAKVITSNDLRATGTNKQDSNKPEANVTGLKTRAEVEVYYKNLFIKHGLDIGPVKSEIALVLQLADEQLKSRYGSILSAHDFESDEIEEIFCTPKANTKPANGRKNIAKTLSKTYLHY